MRHLQKGCVLLAGALVFSVGCSITNEKYIVGTWQAEAPCEAITLSVNRDHSFVQSVRTSSGDLRSLLGRWHFDSIRGWIDFEPFLDFANDTNGRRVASFGSPHVELLPKGPTMGPLLIKCPDSFHQIDYVKADPVMDPEMWIALLLLIAFAGIVLLIYCNHRALHRSHSS